MTRVDISQPPIDSIFIVNRPTFASDVRATLFISRVFYFLSCVPTTGDVASRRHVWFRRRTGSEEKVEGSEISRRNSAKVVRQPMWAFSFAFNTFSRLRKRIRNEGTRA